MYAMKDLRGTFVKVKILINYREFSPNANFITANLVTAVFQNFLDTFCYCNFISILLMRFYVLFILLLRSLAKICLMRFLANANFSRSQKSH